jgi:very-short-patch-repair endonuclease
VIEKTPFLDPYEASPSVRAFHIRKGLSFPLVNFNTNKLASRAVWNRLEEITGLAESFESKSYKEKIVWIRNWLSNKSYTRTKLTAKINCCYPIFSWIKAQTQNILELSSCTDISLLAFHLAENTTSMPSCKQCSKPIHYTQFNRQLRRYPATCSRVCNNKYAEVIEKRLANNRTNLSGYQTNVGKNEQQLLNRAATIYKLDLQYGVRKGKYFIDGVDEHKKVVVEIQEKHHARTKQFSKDVDKVLFLLRQGYNVVLVLDGWFVSRTKKSIAQTKYKNFFEALAGVKVLSLNLSEGAVLTDTGWSSFCGVKKTIANQPSLKFETKDGRSITTTKDHLIFYTADLCKKACEYAVGDSFYTENGSDAVTSINETDEQEFYDIIETETHTFFANGIKVHNCLAIDEAAFIESHLLEEFWASVIPSVSSGLSSKILMVSTPNGVGNKFYEIYTEAEKKANGWVAERVDWWDVPGRDEAWKKTMISALGSEEKFHQEFGNSFLDNNVSVIGAALIEKLKREKKPPVWTSEGGEYTVFAFPDPTHHYVIGVDVGEGIGRAASVAQVLDITDLQNIEQVAVYSSSIIEPYHFANKLNVIGNSWGVAPMLIERNNCGAQVIDALYHKHQYEKLISYSKISESEKYNKTRNIGVLSHTNIRFDGVQNLRYWVNHLQAVRINDSGTISELETFVRHPNGIFRKKTDVFFDDRVMSLTWALFILEPEICQQYFEITEFDLQHKPLKIASNGFWETVSSTYNLRDVGPTEHIIQKPGPAFSSLNISNDELADLDKYELDMESLESMGYSMYLPDV